MGSYYLAVPCGFVYSDWILEIETLACQHITGAIRMVQTIDSLRKKTLLIAPKKTQGYPRRKTCARKRSHQFTRENADLAEHSFLEDCFFFFFVWGELCET